MMMYRQLLVLFTLYTLIEVHGIRGQVNQLRKKRNQDSFLFRLSSLEKWAVPIQTELVQINARLDEFQKISLEITSRLDELSGMTVQRQAYDKDVIKSTLDSIQDGLANEKQQRLKLDTIAQETKKMVAEQNKLFERKTELFEERDKQHRLEIDTIAQETNKMIAKQNKLFEKKTELFEERDKQHRLELDTIAQETNKMIAKQNKLFERKTELFEERDKQHRLELETIAQETNKMIAEQNKLFKRKTRVLENSITKLERTCTNICSITTVAPAESTTSPARPAILSTRPPTTSPTTHKAKDCWELKAVYGISKDGVYEVVSPDGRKINVRCDMTTDGGGWTVFQRRGDGSVRFDKTYEDYKLFFGNLTGEFWMGNDFLNVFTRDFKQTLRVDICDWDNDARWAKYNDFSVGPSADNYRLGVEDYSGTAGDALITGYKGRSWGSHNGEAFSAPGGDHDNAGGDCASGYQSGWWFNRCYSANLNGLYQPETSSHTLYGIQWHTWIDYHSFKGSEMKMRPSTSSTSSTTNKPFNCPVI